MACPGRTPHLQAKVLRGKRESLTTQLFMPDEDAANRADFLWRRLEAESRPLVLAAAIMNAGRD